MHPLESHIAKNWKEYQSATIYIAASGGLDSTSLAFVLNKLNFKVEVLHVNYQLRGEDSENDAQFIQEFCKKNQIPFHQKTISLSSELQSGGNLQELARNVRYDWFTEFLAKNEDSYLALAHHKNDQVETFFLNLSRKSGVMGLAGMLEKNGQFIRPFLDLSKEEIKNYALENNINWREDASNSSNKYRRNFLRNVILPILNAQIPSLEESVLILVNEFQKRQTELEKKISPLIDLILKDAKLETRDFRSLSKLEQIEFLRQLGQSSNRRKELVQLATLENGKQLNLSLNQFGFESIVKKNEFFYFLKEKNTKSTPQLIIESIDSLPQTFSKNELYLDANKLKGELVLRKWQVGDRIKPIGMKGSKLISDVIKDASISPLQKQEILVVTDDEEVHWCVGLVVGRVAVAKEFSENVVMLSFNAPSNRR